MHIELSINDDAFDIVLVKVFEQHLLYTRNMLNRAKEGRLGGCYSWTDSKIEIDELKKDIKAYERILMLYGYEKNKDK